MCVCLGGCLVIYSGSLDDKELACRRRGGWKARTMGIFRVEEKGRKKEEAGGEMLSPGVLRVSLIHNSPLWQTFIHILTPHGCAHRLPCLSMDAPLWRSVQLNLLYPLSLSQTGSLGTSMFLFLNFLFCSAVPVV